MRALMFRAKRYDRASFDASNCDHRQDFDFLDVRLDERTVE